MAGDPRQPSHNQGTEFIHIACDCSVTCTKLEIPLEHGITPYYTHLSRSAFRWTRHSSHDIASRFEDKGFVACGIGAIWCCNVLLTYLIFCKDFEIPEKWDFCISKCFCLFHSLYRSCSSSFALDLHKKMKSKICTTQQCSANLKFRKVVSRTFCCDVVEIPDVKSFHPVKDFAYAKRTRW